MDRLVILLLVIAADARMFCEKTKAPLEMGEWKYFLKHLDSAVVENPPTSLIEGQVYVYENNFSNYTIKYIYVDNLAVKTCGAAASIKRGGIGSSSVLIVLKALINQEIRSVVDIWGEKNTANGLLATDRTLRQNPVEAKGNESYHLFKDIRAVSHNKPRHNYLL